MTTLNKNPDSATPIDPKTAEFENFFKTKFPKIWASRQNGELGGNELWLFDLCRMAYFGGWEGKENHVDSGLTW